MRAKWITPKLLLSIDKKHRWWRMSRRGEITKECYRKYCADLRKLIKSSKNNYYVNRFNALGNNMRKNWKLLNSLLGKNKDEIAGEFKIQDQLISDPKKICEDFSNYFVSHPQNIHNNITSSNVDYLSYIPRNHKSWFVTPVTKEEIQKQIMTMKKEGALGDIPRRVLKMCMDHISEIISDFYNRCITQGKYPDIFKIAQITPVYKKGQKNRIENHRPISILPNLSKIFENIIYSRLSSFFHDCNILTDNQYGYRKHKNTELAIFTLVERLMPAFENKLYGICVSLDYSACFDTISRSCLLQKLDRHGVRGVPYELMESYFENRTQCVKYRGVVSKSKPQELGVVQGSKCGPLLYDIYTSDIANVCDDAEYIMYADDTILMMTGNNLDELERRMNRKLEQISEWCRFNKLSLNASKCNYMLLTNKRILSDPNIKIDGAQINRVHDTKYLGIHLDENLKYHKQIENLESKLSRLSGVAYRLKKGLNMKAAKSYYYSCIYATVNYCICVWGGVLQSTGRGTKLCKLYEKCVRNIFYGLYPQGECPFKSINILKLKDIHIFCASVYMYRALKNDEFPTLQNNLNARTAVHEHNTRTRENLQLPFPRVENIRINYIYQCQNIWNCLPQNIKSSPSLKIFKKNLHKHMIEMY